MLVVDDAKSVADKLKDLRDINRIIEKISEKESKVVFGNVASDAGCG